MKLFVAALIAAARSPIWVWPPTSQLAFVQLQRLAYGPTTPTPVPLRPPSISKHVTPSTQKSQAWITPVGEPSSGAGSMSLTTKRKRTSPFVAVEIDAEVRSPPSAPKPGTSVSPIPSVPMATKGWSSKVAVPETLTKAPL